MAATPDGGEQVSPPRRGADRLLLFVHVPIYRDGGRFFVERQAANGFRLWASNFGHVTVMAPLYPGAPPEGFVPAETIGAALERLTFLPLPMAYRPDRFLKQIPAARRLIRAEIGKADYLCFGIGGFFGDWGAVSAIEARRVGRPYAVWTDRVESEVIRHKARNARWNRHWRERLTHRPMAMLERRVIGRADLGLFHGRETLAAYGHLPRRAELVHNIHIGKGDHISPVRLQDKIAAVASGPLNILYVGRADPMKGPQDWVEVLALLRDRGVDFRAAWFGAGFQYDAMRERIRAADLADRVEAPGMVRDRRKVLEALRAAQVFLFCHKTPESPRCLIEALISATPIVGYEGAFARDLIAEHGGGVLTPANDIPALADAVAALAADRGRLQDLIARAARDGDPFDDESVFRHRADLIHRYL